MSAWMCSDAHFDALAQYAADRRVEVHGIAPGTTAAREAGEIFGATHSTYSARLSLSLAHAERLTGALLRDQNARSVEYRYEESLAALVLDAIKDAAIDEITKPEPWGLEEEHVRPRLVVILAEGHA